MSHSPFTLAQESPLTEDLTKLFDRHTADMHFDTPPESIHMMDRGALAVPEISFFTLREGQIPLAMGAFKKLSSSHGEIKSMHVLKEHRGRGLSNLMLGHLIAQARAAGLTRLSLETGAQPSFIAARNLYSKAGFSECPPFEGYKEDPNSVFMTKEIG